MARLLLKLPEAKANYYYDIPTKTNKPKLKVNKTHRPPAYANQELKSNPYYCSTCQDRGCNDCSE